MSRRVIDDFDAYATACLTAFGDRVGMWLTINEPWCPSVLGYENGEMAPGRTSAPPREPNVVAHHLLLAHVHAVACYRRDSQATQGGKVGLTMSVDWKVPLTASALDHAARGRGLNWQLGWFAEPIWKSDYPPLDAEALQGPPPLLHGGGEEPHPQIPAPSMPASEDAEGGVATAAELQASGAVPALLEDRGLPVPGEQVAAAAAASEPVAARAEAAPEPPGMAAELLCAAAGTACGTSGMAHTTEYTGRLRRTSIDHAAHRQCVRAAGTLPAAILLPRDGLPACPDGDEVQCRRAELHSASDACLLPTGREILRAHPDPIFRRVEKDSEHKPVPSCWVHFTRFPPWSSGKKPAGAGRGRGPAGVQGGTSGTYPEVLAPQGGPPPAPGAGCPFGSRCDPTHTSLERELHYGGPCGGERTEPAGSPAANSRGPDRAGRVAGKGGNVPNRAVAGTGSNAWTRAGIGPGIPPLGAAAVLAQPRSGSQSARKGAQGTGSRTLPRTRPQNEPSGKTRCRPIFKLGFRALRRETRAGGGKCGRGRDQEAGSCRAECANAVTVWGAATAAASPGGSLRLCVDPPGRPRLWRGRGPGAGGEAAGGSSAPQTTAVGANAATAANAAITQGIILHFHVEPPGRRHPRWGRRPEANPEPELRRFGPQFYLGFCVLASTLTYNLQG